MVFDCALVLNSLTGDTFEDFLSIRSNRLLWAEMIRECLAAFTAASKSGGWSPDCGASCVIPLWLMEQVLCLPTVLFHPMMWAFLGVSPGLGAPMQDDLRHRKRSNGEFTLRELTNVGSKNMVLMPACDRVLVLLRSAVLEKNGVPCLKSTEIIASINSSFPSTRQLISSCFLMLSALFGLFVLNVFVDVLLPRESL
jgi:2-dehydropantoate 2-reductase